MSLKLYDESGKEKDKYAVVSDERRTNVHVIAAAFRHKMEDLGELQWIRTIVDLDDGDGGVI
jgi:hypothetical protein